MEALWQDAKQAARGLAKSPGFTLVAVLTLALAIGANTAMFSAFYSALVKPLPYANPEQLFMLWEDASFYGSPKDTPAAANFFDWREQSHSFPEMAAMSTDTMNLTGSGEPEQVGVAASSANLFSILGVRPQFGRVFVAGEDAEGKPGVAVLSHRFWQRKFGGDAGVVGRSLVLDSRPFTVIGIMPATFTFPADLIDLWTAFPWNPELRNNREDHYLWVVGRLNEGISPVAAQAEMKAIATRLSQAHPETNTNLGCNIEPLRDFYAGDVRPALLALMGAVGLVLLVACANVANLLLVRSAHRSRDLCVRVALGASRQHLMRLVLTESFLLAGAGVALGIALAVGLVRMMRVLLPAGWSGGARMELSLPVLGFAVALALLTSLLFGFAPALQVSRVRLLSSLNQNTRTVAGGGHQVRSALVVGEIALSLCLLIGAGLMLRTLVALANAPLGFKPEGAMLVRTPLGGEKYRPHDVRVRFFRQVLEKVHALPGVVAAGYSTNLPLTFGGNQNSVIIEGRPVPPPGQFDIVPVRIVTPNYFRAVGTALLQGRATNDFDTVDSERVALVNQSFARRFWPQEDPLGKRFQRGTQIVEGGWLRVVGVVEDTPQVSVESGAKAEIYLPHTQFRGYFFVPKDLVVRAAGDPLMLAGPVRDAIHAIDKDQPVAQAVTLESVVAGALAQRRMQSALFLGFAAIALVLAAVGLFGVLSQLVAQRTREFGIRMALGAQAGDVLRMVLRHALALVLLGSALGVLGYLALARFVSSLLYQVSGTDPWTIAGVTGLLAAVALLACVFPAWRASRVDPNIVLRYE
jgi:putative ABC transport system permease protein